MKAIDLIARERCNGGVAWTRRKNPETKFKKIIIKENHIDRGNDLQFIIIHSRGVSPNKTKLVDTFPSFPFQTTIYTNTGTKGLVPLSLSHTHIFLYIKITAGAVILK